MIKIILIKIVITFIILAIVSLLVKLIRNECDFIDRILYYTSCISLFIAVIAIISCIWTFN